VGSLTTQLQGTTAKFSGTVTANAFEGDGSKLSNIAASNVGTISLSSSNGVTTLTGLVQVNNQFIDASGGAKVINLPTAASGVHVIYTFTKSDSSGNTVTITPSGAEKISGQSTFVLTTQNQALSIMSNGTDWYIF
jgi:hypothetical protein